MAVGAPCPSSFVVADDAQPGAANVGLVETLTLGACIATVTANTSARSR